MTIISSSWEQTFNVGKELAEKLNPGDVIAFHGDLGAGKTVFVRGLAEGLGLDARVTSPTFTIVNEYDGKIPLFHFDMYRLSGSDELFEIGWEDYLSRGGEDNDHYYSVKLDAAKLLLDHTDDTFVTPVFNGSASLRNAAGQLIENTTKSVRRSETVDDAYMEKLYADITSLYRLDNLSSSIASGKADLGPLPATSVALLSALGGTWVLIFAYIGREMLKKRKK